MAEDFDFVNRTFLTHLEADEYITRWALSRNFLVKKGSLDKCKVTKTPIGRNLYCKFARCPFKINLRKQEGTWRVTSHVLYHNHPLTELESQVRKTRCSAAKMYNELLETAGSQSSRSAPRNLPIVSDLNSEPLVQAGIPIQIAPVVPVNQSTELADLLYGPNPAVTDPFQDFLDWHTQP